MGIFIDYKDEDAIRERNHSKWGDYSGSCCKNCGRNRVMIGDDKKHRCEKCGWCLELCDYDNEFRHSLRF